MKCVLKNRDRIIAEYLHAELEAAESAAFEEHFFDCRDCLRDLQIGKEAITLIEREGAAVLTSPATREQKPRRSLAEFLSWRNWSAQPQRAFAFAAIILLALVGARLGWREFFQSAPQPTLAENFQPSPRLDDLMQQTYQAPTLLGRVEPANDATVSAPILFRWDAPNFKPASGWEVRLMNNKEEELARATVTTQSWRYDKTLAPGLYYWAVLTENEMAHLGRFYVK